MLINPTAPTNLPAGRLKYILQSAITLSIYAQAGNVATTPSLVAQAPNP
jgi:hypothetical protein